MHHGHNTLFLEELSYPLFEQYDHKRHNCPTLNDHNHYGFKSPKTHGVQFDRACSENNLVELH